MSSMISRGKHSRGGAGYGEIERNMVECKWPGTNEEEHKRCDIAEELEVCCGQGGQ